ncbi:MAG: hypothetical protein PHE18_00600 [Candidatus Omnitrophica bacterium]|nr:hypothetical protein [Candidatus Omnitrophota bacterium]MDD5552361.1 hypothetical protein [Candidatus Omnitrophota bacterium]
MSKKTVLLSLILFVFPVYSAFSQEGAPEYPPVESQTSTDAQGGRYVLVTVNKSGSYAASTYSSGTSGARILQKKTPAAVLDSYMGVVYRCTDIKAERPLWIKSDLGKNSGKTISKKKYSITVPAYSGEDYKIPAIVLDIDEGKAWVCSDLVSESSIWIQTDLPKEITKEGYQYRYQ